MLYTNNMLVAGRSVERVGPGAHCIRRLPHLQLGHHLLQLIRHTEVTSAWHCVAGMQLSQWQFQLAKVWEQMSGEDLAGLRNKKKNTSAVCSTSSPYSCPAGSPSGTGPTAPLRLCWVPTLHLLHLVTLSLLTFVPALHPLQMVRVPGPHVDVNVHPTKREVSFLFEDRLVEAVCATLQQALTHTTSR